MALLDAYKMAEIRISELQSQLDAALQEVERLREDVRRFCKACDGSGDETMCEECPGPIVLRDSAPPGDGGKG